MQKLEAIAKEGVSSFTKDSAVYSTSVEYAGWLKESEGTVCCGGTGKLYWM